MFTWIERWFHQEEPKPKRFEEQITPQPSDSMESALWDMKEEYDFGTEEISLVVEQKRTYIQKLKSRLKNK